MQINEIMCYMLSAYTEQDHNFVLLNVRDEERHKKRRSNKAICDLKHC